jgi:hypothetical protein
MALYLITSAHEPEQCLDALDEIMAKRPDTLNKFVYGCKEGDHAGYAIVDAESRSAALNLLPDILQETACVTKVDKFTPADIRAFHAKAA